MRKSGFLKRIDDDQQALMKAAEAITRMYDVDTLQITLNEELGLGYDRIMRFTAKWMANQEKYVAAVRPRLDVEADVAQEHLDRRLAQIAARRKVPLIPFAERYTLLRKIKY